MKNKHSHFILISILLVSCELTYSQSSSDNYNPLTLKGIIKQHSDSEVLRDSNVFLSGDTFPYLVKVSYTGKSRKISAARKELIANWAKSRGMNPKIADMFETELLFIEDPVEYWLPVPKPVIPSFERELKKDEQVTLFAIWIGAKKIDGKWEWIFLVNEFEK